MAATFEEAAAVLEQHDYTELERTPDAQAIYCLPGLLGRHPRYINLPLDMELIPDYLLTFIMEAAGVPYDHYQHLLGH